MGHRPDLYTRATDPRLKLTPEQWAELFGRYLTRKETGDTVKGLCREYGISFGLFYRYQRRVMPKPLAPRKPRRKRVSV